MYSRNGIETRYADCLVQILFCLFTSCCCIFLYQDATSYHHSIPCSNDWNEDGLPLRNDCIEDKASIAVPEMGINTQKNVVFHVTTYSSVLVLLFHQKGLYSFSNLFLLVHCYVLCSLPSTTSITASPAREGNSFCTATWTAMAPPMLKNIDKHNETKLPWWPNKWSTIP